MTANFKLLRGDSQDGTSDNGRDGDGPSFFLIFGTFEDEHGEDAEQNEDGQFR